MIRRPATLLHGLALAACLLQALPARADECPVEPNQCYFTNQQFTYDGERYISAGLPVGSVLGTLNLSLDYACRLQEYLSGEAGRYIVLGIASEASHRQGNDFATNIDGLVYRVIPSGQDGVGVKQVGGVEKRIQLGVVGDRSLGPSQCVSGSLSNSFIEVLKNGNIDTPGTYPVNFREPALFVGSRWNNTPPAYPIDPFPDVALTFLPTTCEMTDAPTRVDFGSFSKNQLPLQRRFEFHWQCDGGAVIRTTLSPASGVLTENGSALLHESAGLLLKIKDLLNEQYVVFNQPVEHVVRSPRSLGFDTTFEAELLAGAEVRPGPFEFVVLYTTEYK
ncbi:MULTISPECIES: hypothetical protein [Pseudomonas]|uniref:hypothetical protein n=1 Tax=Pseudomonas TaxID=286 RepID=UPI000D6FBDB7|nr:hypothetical protein [Pseudomonas sp. RW407]PWU30579.1 hypothetical protein DK254_10890 [Pseudomonas sp. RW407]